jgi:hypothetical protein
VKILKMLGLAVCAAIAAMAFVGSFPTARGAAVTTTDARSRRGPVRASRAGEQGGGVVRAWLRRATSSLIAFVTRQSNDDHSIREDEQHGRRVIDAAVPTPSLA